jgi:actin related protein 2/3 complex subunit 1A/1B
MFLSEVAIVGVGHDFNPALFNSTKGKWDFYSYVDKVDDVSAPAALESASSVSKARELFKSKTVRGQDMKSDSDALKTKHERLVNSLCNATAGRGAITTISTTGYDGKLIKWNLPSLNIAFSSMSV